MFVRNKWLMLFVLLIILLISACGNSDNSNDEEISSSESDSEVEEDDEEIQDEIPLSEVLDKEGLWFEAAVYDIDKFDEDTRIYHIYVFESGKYTRYMTPELVFEDVVNQSKEEVIEIAIELHNDEMKDWPVSEEFIDQAYDLGFLYEQDNYEVNGMQMYQDNGEDKSHLKGDNLVNTFTEGIFESSIDDKYFEGFYMGNGDALITRVNEESLGLFKYDDSDADKESVKFQEKY